MSTTRSASSQPSRLESVPILIMWSTAVVLLVGPAASIVWWETRNPVWLDAFFSYAGTLFLLACSALGAALSYVICRQFSSGELLRPAWFLICLSGVCQAMGVVARHVLASQSLINPFVYLPAAQGTVLIDGAGEIAQIFSPLCMALLASGLFYILRACRRNGVLANLRLPDFILMGIVTAYTTHYFATVVFPTSSSGSVLRVLSAWTTDPLLCVLLLEAILILRSAANLGWGLIPRCWLAFTAAIFLTSLGDMGLWAFTEGYLPPALVALSWHIWFVAAACFALGPAYQLQAILQATRGFVVDDIVESQLITGVSARNEA